MHSPTTDPKKQLELLVAHQEEFEIFLNALTGLNVKVSLGVHPARNFATDLLQLFEASMTMPNFEAVSASNRIWITHTDPKRDIAVFMPDGFDHDELHPEQEDDEGYEQAVEVANAERAAARTDTQEDEIPF